jgi:PAS domain S-box-containing protein
MSAGVAEPLLQQVLLYDALDRGPALIFVADDEMRYLAANQTACDVLGYTREELLALRVTDVAVEPAAEELYRDMLQTRSQEGVTHLRTKNGRLLRFAYRASEVKVVQLTHYVSIGFVTEEIVD